MAQIPLNRNYDEFLWRTVKSGTGYKLINKKLGEGKCLDSSQEELTISNKGASGGQEWPLENANPAKHGTNVYILTNSQLGGKAFQYKNREISTAPLNAKDSLQCWVFQPMELAAGYRIPPMGLGGFDRILTLPYGYMVVASNTVSDWALLNAHLIYKNILSSMLSSQVAKMKKDTINKKLIVMISKDDSSTVDSTTTPFILGTFDTAWMHKYRGGASSNGTTVITEEMMNKEGVYTRGGADKSYREFEQVVHEFGHAIDMICNLNTQNQRMASTAFPSNPAEWFPWEVQEWFNSAHSSGGQYRAKMDKRERDYVATVFDSQNTWLPPRKLRETDSTAILKALRTGKTATLKYQPSMKPGEKLLEGEKIVSANGQYQLRGTSDGSFIIEEIPSGRFIGELPTTQGMSNPPAVSFLSYNPDGNLAINSKQGRAYYASNGSDALAAVILRKSVRAELTDDGRFVLINDKGEEIWANAERTTP